MQISVTQCNVVCCNVTKSHFVKPSNRNVSHSISGGMMACIVLQGIACSILCAACIAALQAMHAIRDM